MQIDDKNDFREYCRQWLADNHPGNPSVHIPQSALEISSEESLEYLVNWQKSAYEAGLIACDYPVEVGGRGKQGWQKIANEEMQRAKTPYLPNVIGLGMAAPTVFYHGREEVKNALLPKLFSGEEIWCQGFSEPNAGSDLSNQETFAQKDGDNWIINGHKLWTSLAHFSTWMILLCRTSRDDKYKGLSYFVVPIKEALGKGVTVRPLIKMTGERGFNEVIFENLVVEDKYRLGAEGEGWNVAMTTLTHERGAGKLITPASGGMSIEADGVIDPTNPHALISLAKQGMRYGKCASDDPVIRDALMKVIIRYEGLKNNKVRNTVPDLLDHPMRISLQHKLHLTELIQDTAEVARMICGENSNLYINDKNALAAGQWQMSYMNSYGGTIAAGTSEIQRNILGERVLGLAKTK